MFQLHAQGVGETFYGVFRRAVRPLNRDRAIREHTADIDESAAASLQVFRRGKRAVNQAPIVRFEQSAMVFKGNVFHFP